jgi:hypothetical protein
MTIKSMIGKAVAGLALAGLSVAGVASHAWAVDAGTMAKYASAIRKIESTNRYHVTADAGRGRRALGAYQILDTNLASRSRAAVGRAISQAEFLRSPHLQDRGWGAKAQPVAGPAAPIDLAARRPPTPASSCVRRAGEKRPGAWPSLT